MPQWGPPLRGIKTLFSRDAYRTRTRVLRNHSAQLGSVSKVLELTRSSSYPIMSPRSRSAAGSLCSILLLSSAIVSAQNEECHIYIDPWKYDLNTTRGDHSVERTRVTPPSTIRESVRFNLCDELQPLDGVASEDQVSAPPPQYYTRKLHTSPHSVRPEPKSA